MTRSRNALRAAVFGTLALSVTALPAAAFDDAEKAEIGTIVREYLLANPEVMLEVQQALEAKQQAEEDQRRRDIITSSADALTRNAADPVLGNPAGDVTVVEFFDYNCGFCRRAYADMNAVIESDPNVRFVLKEFPILGPDSQAAHTVAIAFNRLKPESYGSFHSRLMASEGRVDEALAISVAVDLGVTEDALRAEMQNPAITASVEATYALADGLGITGTPSYVVGNEMVSGALGSDVLREKLAAARECAATKSC